MLSLTKAATRKTDIHNISIESVLKRTGVSHTRAFPSPALWPSWLTRPRLGLDDGQLSFHTPLDGHLPRGAGSGASPDQFLNITMGFPGLEVKH